MNNLILMLLMVQSYVFKKAAPNQEIKVDDGITFVSTTGTLCYRPYPSSLELRLTASHVARELW